MEIQAADGQAGERTSAGFDSEGPDPTTWTAPPVVTAPVGSALGTWLTAVFLLVLAAWIASPALASDGVSTSAATVLGPGRAAGESRVQVLGGPEPKTWIMSGVDAPTGSTIEVDLRGDCACEPYPAAPRRSVDWPAVVMFGCGGAFFAWRAGRVSRAIRTTRTARALLDRPPGPRRFSLVPMVFARGHLELRVGLRDAHDAILGTIPLAVTATRADLERPVRVHGDLRAGRVIALSTEDGTEGLLPTEPLAPIRSARASRPHPATDVVVDLLGWGRVAPPTTVGGTQRVTPSEFGSSRYPPQIVAGVQESAGRLVRAGRWQGLVAFAVMGLGLLIPLAAGPGIASLAPLAAVVALSAAFTRGSTRWADRPLAAALVETGLVPVDADRVARLLLRSGLIGSIDAPEEGSDPVEAGS